MGGSSPCYDDRSAYKIITLFDNFFTAGILPGMIGCLSAVVFCYTRRYTNNGFKSGYV